MESDVQEQIAPERPDGIFSQRWRVLAIDDDPDVLEQYQRLLVQKDNSERLLVLNDLVGIEPDPATRMPRFSLDTASSGRDGFQLVKEALQDQRPYAVICIDMRMAEWDGLRTAVEIRKVDPEVNLIFVTAYTDYELSRIRARIGGNFNLLYKPFAPIELIQSISFLSESWGKQQALKAVQSELDDYREQMTISLALEKEHTELILESMKEAVVVIDRQGNIEEVNPKLEQMIGRGEAEVAGHPFESLFQERKGVRQSIGHPAVHATVIQKRVDVYHDLVGRWIEHSLLAALVVNEDGTISQVNHAMEELSGWRIDQLLNGSLELLLPPQIHDAHSVLMQQFMAQPQARKMGGERILPLVCADGEMIEVEIALLPLNMEGKARVLVVLHNPVEAHKLEMFKLTPLGCLIYKEEEQSEIQTEWLLKGSGGGTIPVHVSGSPIYREEGRRRRFNGVVLVLHDLRQTLSAESAIRANRAKDSFLASMSHELRTPLTSIIGNSELLVRALKDQLDSELYEMLRSIQVAGRAQLALVNDILDLSKIEAGKFEIDQQPFVISTLMQDVEDMFAARARKVDIDFSVQIDARSSRQSMVGDEKRIRQVLVNFLSNAIKFTQRGRVMLSVTFDREQKRIGFHVKDQGIGMSPEVVERLFQPFEQADSSITRRYGGTGLGLHISWNLAELMGGYIDVESKEGVGSTFSLYLPLQLEESKNATQEGLDSGQLPERFRGHVLLAEDTPELQRLGLQMLESLGLTVAVVGNGQEAIEQALGQSFDLILMDMQMPVMGGLEATRTLRALHYRKPIIALTADVMAHHRTQFEEAGGNGFLSKPVEYVAFQRILQEYLEVDEGAAEGGDGLLDRSGEGYQQAIEEFKQQMAGYQQEMEQAIVDKAWGDLARLAHKIKGSGGSFGYPQLTEQAKVVEARLRQEQFDAAGEQAAQLLASIKGIL